MFQYFDYIITHYDKGEKKAQFMYDGKYWHNIGLIHHYYNEFVREVYMNLLGNKLNETIFSCNGKISLLNM